MKAALIGCGSVAGRWIRALLADGRVQIVALVDPNAEAAQRLAAQYGLSVPVAPSFASVNSHVTTDLVCNLTPPEHHYAVSREALLNGQHVLSEKPLCLTLPDALDLVHLARERGLMLGVMQNRRDDEQFSTFCSDVLRQARPPFSITADVLVPLHHPGFRSEQLLPATTDLAVHAFDQVRVLVRASVRSVSCSEIPTPFLGPHTSMTIITANFADGSVFHYRGGFIPHRQQDARTHGLGVWRILAADFAIRWQPDTQESVPQEEPATTTYQRCIATMLDQLTLDNPPPIPATSNLGSIALLDAALTSAKAKRSVLMPEILD